MSLGRLLLGSSAPTVAAVLPVFLVGAMGLQIGADLGFSAAGIGIGVGAFFAAASCGSAALGRLAERVGPSLGLRAASVWSAVAQAVIAVAARSLATLLVLLAVAGAANALVQPAANLFVARHLPVRRQGLGFAVKQSAVPAATLLAGLAVPALALTIGWRWAFAASAGLGLLATVLVPRVPAHAAVRATGDDQAPDTPFATMALLAVGIGLGASAAGALGTFLVSAGVESGLSEGAAGLTLTAGSAVGIAVRVMAGLRADRRDGGHLRVVVLMLIGGSVAYCLLATGVRWVHLAATPLAFGAGWAWPGLFNLAVVKANPRSPAAATGLTQTGTYLGAVVGPLLFGVLAEQVSYAAAWLAAAAMALAAAVAITAGRSRLRRLRDVPDVGPVPA